VRRFSLFEENQPPQLSRTFVKDGCQGSRFCCCHSAISSHRREFAIDSERILGTEPILLLSLFPLQVL
jgi:hypothetical protein